MLLGLLGRGRTCAMAFPPQLVADLVSPSPYLLACLLRVLSDPRVLWKRDVHGLHGC